MEVSHTIGNTLIKNYAEERWWVWHFYKGKTVREKYKIILFAKK